MSDVETGDFLPLSPKLFPDIVLCGQTDNNISISAELALSACKNTQTVCVCVCMCVCVCVVALHSNSLCCA